MRSINFHFSFKGIQQLIDCLQSNVKEIQSLAAETLSHMITFRLAYNAVRRGGGIKNLVRTFTATAAYKRRDWWRHQSCTSHVWNVYLALFIKLHLISWLDSKWGQFTFVCSLYQASASVDEWKRKDGGSFPDPRRFFYSSLLTENLVEV